ncbi:agouti signaling protein 1 [Anguilla rostrata]|uniref:agouti signaling protein 1 n=1 Tax=Anguilla anguilla TaxID=7936 RepID=UPI0015B21FE3|nr:agouti signaling protein 1 [Anguilla anguilla]
MTAKCLLCCLALSSASFLVVYAHMLIEEKSAINASSSSLQANAHSDAPPVLIVELPKTVRRNKKDEKKQRKNKFGGRSKRPPPPANCVPLWGSCKPPNNACCEYCAFCQCRLFKTVCYCRMGNPRC